MSVENVVRKRALMLERIGKSALNVKFPDEFELYVMALELVDSTGKTLRYFIFPVMPSSFEQSDTQIHNIKKTLSGVSVLSTPGFIPGDITLSGNFGRKFRVLLGSDYKDLANSFKDTSGKVTAKSSGKGAQEFFDDRVKTGYGCCKVLEDIVYDANALDADGGVRTLIFHNLALNNSYLVKAMSLRFSQSQDTNMIWNYSLVLKSIAGIEALFTKQQLEQQRQKLVVSGYIQDRLNNVMNALTSSIAKAEEKYS